jgi:hypothetical protein
MPGKIEYSDDSYNHFFAGYNTKHPPLTAQDQHMLDFAIKTADQPVTVTNGQILRNFGMYPPAFWTAANMAAQHPDVSPEQKAEFDKIMPNTSYGQGPVHGGYDVALGLEQYP